MAEEQEKEEDIEEEVAEIGPDDEWEEQEQTGMWMPEKPDSMLIGLVVDIVEGLYGNQFVIKEVGSEDVTLTPSHKVLQNRMTKVKKGDTVKIVFKGEEPPSVKGQNPTKMYEVFVKK